MKKGFTLIELLVVVLIIGILSAVALPKYQKAVKKTHLIKALPTLSAISRAKKVYFLANGSYTDDLDALDINIPYTEKNGGVYTGTPLRGDLVLSSTGQATIWSSPYGFTIEVYEHESYCYGDDELCISAGGTYHFTADSGKNVYKLNF